MVEDLIVRVASIVRNPSWKVPKPHAATVLEMKSGAKHILHGLTDGETLFTLVKGYKHIDQYDMVGNAYCLKKPVTIKQFKNTVDKSLKSTDYSRITNNCFDVANKSKEAAGITCVKLRMWGSSIVAGIAGGVAGYFAHKAVRVIERNVDWLIDSIQNLIGWRQPVKSEDRHWLSNSVRTGLKWGIWFASELVGLGVTVGASLILSWKLCMMAGVVAGPVGWTIAVGAGVLVYGIGRWFW